MNDLENLRDMLVRAGVAPEDAPGYSTSWRLQVGLEPYKTLELYFDGYGKLVSLSLLKA